MWSESKSLAFKTNADFIQKERKIIFEGEEAFLVRSKPFLVIRTNNDSIICGDLSNRFEYID
jgi:hypothetical protein